MENAQNLQADVSQVGLEIAGVLNDQNEFFQSLATYPISFRLNQLQILKNALKNHEIQIIEALKLDLGKPRCETYLTELGSLTDTINHTVKNLEKWMTPERVKTPIFLFPSQSKIYSEPLGKVLIIGPWNYPFQLIFAPLVGAIAAGNCCVLKPSEVTPNCSKIIAKIVNENFPPHYISVFEGGPKVSEALLKEKFEHVFFTGGTEIGRVVARAAADHLTPYTLELGGKSPCIVDESANIKVSAKRIAWGKFFNAGQTCIAPDYILVHKSVKPELTKLIAETVTEFFGENPELSEDYGRIVNEKHFHRLTNFLKNSDILFGGQTNGEKKYISPTLLEVSDLTHPSMKEEIFGPILPIIEYDTLDEAISIVKTMPNPLALYIFSEHESTQNRFMTEVAFGGGCINNTVVHAGCHSLPFGGRGNSGVGSYHGKYTFDLFSHKKSVLKSTTAIDVKLQYPPYKNKEKLFRRIFG